MTHTLLKRDSLDFRLFNEERLISVAFVLSEIKPIEKRYIPIDDSKDINTCIRRCGPEPLSLSLNIKGPSKYFTAISEHYILEDRARTTTAINSITV